MNPRRPSRRLARFHATALSTVAATAALALTGGTLAAAQPNDRDQDGLPDRWERSVGLSVQHASGTADTDHDALRNAREYGLKLDPRERDTDRDGLSDGYEVRTSKTNPRRYDTDRDALSDGTEVKQTRTNALKRDTDGDGLSDGTEVRETRTNPLKRDTDRDGVSDGAEVRRGSDPLQPPRSTNDEGRKDTEDKKDSGHGDGSADGSADGSDPPKPPPPPPPPPGLVHHVDRDSRGGPCADTRTAWEARNPATPWCTIEVAAAAAPAGATVVVREGDYPRFALRALRTGTVTFRSYPGEAPALRGGDVYTDWVRFEELTITGTMTVTSGRGNIAFLRNNWIIDGRSGSLALSLEAGSHDVLVEGNRIGQAAGVSGSVINFSSTDQRPEIVDVTIRGNRIGPGSDGDGIQAKHTRRLLIENNEFFGFSRPAGSASHPDVIQTLYGSVDLTLRGNFIHDVAAQGIFIQSYRGANLNLRAEDNVVTRVAYPWLAFGFNSDGASVSHNTVDGSMSANGRSIDVFANVVSGSLIVGEGAGVARESYNLASRWSGALPGSNSILGRASYLNPGANDFTLAGGSLGKGAAPDGADLGALQPDRSAP